MSGTQDPIDNGSSLILLGAGGHARVLIDLIQLLDRPVRCLLDDDPRLQGKLLDDVSILGGIDTLASHPPADTLLVNAVGSAGLPRARRTVYERGRSAGYDFATLIHPSAVIGSRVRIDRGAQVMAGAVVGPGTEIGEDALINTHASVDHDAVIGPHTHVAPGATVCGGVGVGTGCHIGCGATLIQGVQIGEGVLVAAGAVVVRDVADGARVAGVPAKAF